MLQVRFQKLKATGRISLRVLVEPPFSMLIKFHLVGIGSQMAVSEDGES